MVKQLIKEAMDKNPIGLKEALAEELKTRIALALEAKMDHSDMDDEDEMDNDDDEDEDLEEAQDTWRVTISGMGGATVQGANRNQAVDRALSKMKVRKTERSAYISGVRKKDVKAEKV